MNRRRSTRYYVSGHLSGTHYLIADVRREGRHNDSLVRSRYAVVTDSELVQIEDEDTVRVVGLVEGMTVRHLTLADPGATMAEDRYRITKRSSSLGQWMTIARR